MSLGARRVLKAAGHVLVVLAVVVGWAAPASADATRDQQWYLPFLGVAGAHQYSEGAGVVVAVLDSGVDATHPDLAGNVLAGADVEPGATGNGQTDTDGHGTAMAGLIAGHGHGANASLGVLGLAPTATVLPVKDGDARAVALPDAVDWAVAQGAKVISISQAAQGDSTIERRAVENAIAHDVVVVAGVGNIPGTFVEFPAAYPGVVAVAGVDQQGNHADISITGPEVVLSAPAIDVVRPTLNHGYGFGTGTSDATAIVAGAVALVRARYPNLSATEVVHRLTATAIDKGAPGRDDVYGYGIVNPVGALTANVPPLPQQSPSANPSQTETQQPQPTRTTPWLFVAIGVALLVLAAAGLIAATRRRRT